MLNETPTANAAKFEGLNSIISIVPGVMSSGLRLGPSGVSTTTSVLKLLA